MFDEGLKMLDQISQNDFLQSEIKQFSKIWPNTIEFTNKYMNHNQDSESKLPKISEENSESSKSNRFMTNKSMERKNKNLKGLFKKQSDNNQKNNINEKVFILFKKEIIYQKIF